MKQKFNTGLKILLASNSTATSTVVPFLKGHGMPVQGWTSIDVIFASLEPENKWK